MIKNFIFLEEREVNVLVIYRNIDLACGVGTRTHLELFSKPTSHTHTALYQSKTGLETLTLLNQLILKPEHLWDVLYPNPVDGDRI